MAPTIPLTTMSSITTSTGIDADNLNLNFIADTFNLGGTITSAASGAGRNISISPYTASSTIGVGDSATCGGSCNISYNDAFINNITSNVASITFGNNTSGPVDINTGAIFSKSLSIISGDNITLHQSLIENVSSGTIDVLLKAVGNIIVSGNIINSGIGKMNITLNSDSAGNHNGGITFGNNISLTTNGGNIIMGGGSNPLTTPAYGTSVTSFNGITFNGFNDIIDAGGGNIFLNGACCDQAYGFGQDVGIIMQGVTIRTIGNGTITLSAQNIDNGVQSDGILFYSYTPQISSVNGNITLNVSGSTNGGNNNNGIETTAGGVIKTTGSGNIIVNAAAGTTGQGIVSDSANLFQTTGTGNIIINSDSYSLVANSINSAGSLTLAPYTHGVSIGVGTGSGTVNITDSILTNLTYNSLIIGDTVNTGAVDFNSSYAFAKPLTLLSHSNVTLDSQINDSYSGTAVVVAAVGNFINNYGAGVFNLTGTSPNWDVYSTQASSDVGGAATLSPDYTTTGQTYLTASPSSLTHPTNNNWIYNPIVAGTITLTALDQTVNYGTAPNSSAILGTTYSFSCSTGCSSSVLTGGPTFSFTGGPGMSTSNNYRVGDWVVTLSGAADSNGYIINYSTATLTVNTLGINISGFAASNKTYSGTTAATISSNGSLSGVVGADSVSLNSGSATATFDNKNVGTTHTVTASGYSLTSGNGNSDASNYTLTQPTASNVHINAEAITIAAAANTRTYNGLTDAAATPTITSGSIMTGDTPNFIEAYASKNAGIGLTLTPSGTVTDGNSGNNYTYTFTNNTAGVINRALLTVAADNKSMTYGGSNPTLTDTITGYVNSENAASAAVTGSASLSTNATTSGVGSYDAGNWTITAAANNLSAANYDFNYANGTLTVGKAHLTVTADNKTITQGDPAPVLTYNYAGLVNGDSSANFTGGLSRTGSTAAGIYSIVRNTLSAIGNYVISTYNPGTFTINAGAQSAPPETPTTTIPNTVTRASQNSSINSYSSQSSTYTINNDGFPLLENTQTGITKHNYAVPLYSDFQGILFIDPQLANQLSLNVAK
jgi:hypothetical protein